MNTARQEIISSIHAAFCEASGRTEHIRYHERAWDHILTEIYSGNAVMMSDDMHLMVRYLKVQIAAGRRNNGALKLFNFLQPDKWDSDRAEATAVMMRKSKKPSPRSAPAAPAAGVERPEGLPVEAVAKGVRELRDKLRGGKA